MHMYVRLEVSINIFVSAYYVPHFLGAHKLNSQSLPLRSNYLAGRLAPLLHRVREVLSSGGAQRWATKQREFASYLISFKTKSCSDDEINNQFRGFVTFYIENF